MFEVVSWNCNQKFSKKYMNLKQDLDVYVIQECERASIPTFKEYTNHWCGINQNKGLSVFTKERSKLSSKYLHSKFKYALPIELKQIRILAVWFFNHRVRADEPFESGYFVDALNFYKEWLVDSKYKLIIGDFNNSAVWDSDYKKNNSWREIKDCLGNIGMNSTYHSFVKEDFGSESMNTFYLHKNNKNAYHIDYIFKDESVYSSCAIGDYEYFKKASDHVPIYGALDFKEI